MYKEHFEPGFIISIELLFRLNRTHIQLTPNNEQRVTNNKISYQSSLPIALLPFLFQYKGATQAAMPQRTLARFKKMNNEIENWL